MATVQKALPGQACCAEASGAGEKFTRTGSGRSAKSQMATLLSHRADVSLRRGPWARHSERGTLWRSPYRAKNLRIVASTGHIGSPERAPATGRAVIHS